ncbi:hypothetical protein D3C74_343840 [compost metagenome]
MVSILPIVCIYHKIHIVYDRRNPNGIDAKSMQVIHFSCNTSKIATMIGFSKSFVITDAIVKRISVKKTICQ